MSLMISISGIRGIVGDSLTPGVIVKYAAAYAEYCNRGLIVLGRDGRCTGSLAGNLVASTLLAMGCDVVAIGIVPTPTVQIAVEQLHAAGGIAVTASHNPMEWNGLKFMSSTGMFLDGPENERFWSIANRGFVHYAPWDKQGHHRNDDSFLQRHIDMVLGLPYIHPQEIWKRKLTVVVDCINAAGGMIVPQMLRALGCSIIEMNCDVSGIFSRMPEPIPEHLGELCNAVVREKADLGIAVDPDVDRLVLIDERGKPFGEEYTITAVVNFILGHLAPPPAGSSQHSVVVNLSTTRAVDDVARRYGAEVVRTPVGEINVAKRMKAIGAIIGGEGSGGVILPAVHYGRDAIAGIGLILQQLAEFSGTLSMLKRELPAYSIVKARVSLSGVQPDEILAGLRSQPHEGGALNTEDGLKISFGDSWVHLRKSNTEPLIRIIAEAPTAEGAQSLVETYRLLIQQLSGTR